MNQVLVIFARYPDPGRVKTRLSPDLTPEEASEIHRAMTEDVVSLHSADPSHDTIVCFTPEESLGEFKSWLGEEIRLLPQAGDDLGVRQLNALRSALGLGYEKVVIIGSDCPCATLSDIESAFRLLDSRDLVLGPSADGGFYLIGARKVDANLLDDIEWGGPHVLLAVLKNAEIAGANTGLLSLRFDVDRFDDIEMLYSVLKAQAEKDWPGPVVAKSTFGVLDSIFTAGD